MTFFFDHQILMISFLSPSGRDVPDVMKFPPNISDTMHSRVQDGREVTVTSVHN